MVGVQEEPPSVSAGISHTSERPYRLCNISLQMELRDSVPAKSDKKIFFVQKPMANIHKLKCHFESFIICSVIHKC